MVAERSEPRLPSREWTVEISERMKVAHSYSNLVLHHWSGQPRRPQMGTAVMLRAGDRFFALTAAHCVSPDMELSIKVHEGRSNRTVPILDRHADHDLDLAALWVEDTPGVTFCDIEQLHVVRPGAVKPNLSWEKQPWVWVMGFPSRLAELDDLATLLTLEQMTFAAFLIRVDHPILGLYYPDQGHRITYGEERWQEKPYPVTPEGFSGGGVWAHMEVEGNEPYLPIKHVKLWGIQRAWYPDSRELVCVSSEAILRMLFTHYPDIEAQYRHLLPARNQQGPLPRVPHRD